MANFSQKNPILGNIDVFKGNPEFEDFMKNRFAGYMDTLPERFGKGGYYCDGCGKLTRQDYKRLLIPFYPPKPLLLCRGCCSKISKVTKGIILK